MDYYWSLNPKQFQKHIDNYEKKEEERIKQVDVFNYNLGKYVMLAFNDPKHYPDKPLLSDFDASDIKKDEVMSSEQMERVAKYNTIKMGGTIKNGKDR